jgi:glycine cleavage system H protein
VSQIPENLYYAASHEWLALHEDGTATIGITDFAQGELGDVVFVELPAIGSQVAAGQAVSVVESVKTASDINAPAAGEIVAVNEALSDSPELINAEPYAGGWIFKLKLADQAALADLLGAADYQANTGG